MICFCWFQFRFVSLARVRTTFCDQLVGETHHKNIFKLKRTNYNDWLNILMSNLKTSEKLKNVLN